MKKRRLIPFAALALTCGLMAGVFAGCNGGGETPPPPTEHQHAYTQWDSNGEEHWKVCPDDGAIDESSRGQHTYVDGECECGKEEPAPEIVYGTASGQVQLKKYGAAVTDYSGVTVSVNDDGVTVSYDEETGRFTVSNAVVGTYYRLTVSKEGYEDYQTEFAVQEGSDTVIGGTEGIALNFLYATLDRSGSGAAIDHVNKTISLGGGNTAPDVDGKESSKATLVAEETTSSESYFFDFTVKQTETTEDGGGWRRFSVTTTDSNVGFLFIYNTNDTAAEVGTVRAIAQDTIAEDGGTLLPAGFNTLDALQTGVKFRIIKAGTQITLYAAGADGSYVQIAATSCAAEAKNVFSFRGSYDTWQFSGISSTDVEYTAEVPPTSTAEGTEAYFKDAEGNYYDITGKEIEAPVKIPVLIENVKITLTLEGEGTFTAEDIAITDAAGAQVEFSVEGNVISLKGDLRTGEYTITCSVPFYSAPAKFTIVAGDEQNYTASIALDYARIDVAGSASQIDSENKTITLGGKNTSPDAPSKATLNPVFGAADDIWFLDFTGKQTVATDNGGGWRRFSVTTTDSNVGFLFIYNTDDTKAAVGTVRTIAQDNLAGDADQIKLPEFCNTLEQLQAGVKFRIVRANEYLTLYAYNADGALVQLAQTECAAEAENVFSFRGSYDTWQFSEMSFTEGLTFHAEVPPTSTAEGTEAYFTSASGTMYNTAGEEIKAPVKIPVLIENVTVTVTLSEGGTLSADRLAVTDRSGRAVAFTLKGSVLTLEGNLQVGTYTVTSTIDYYLTSANFEIKAGETQAYAVTLNYSFATADRGGESVGIDAKAGTITLGGKNTGPDVDKTVSAKATLNVNAGGDFAFEFTVKQTETTGDGGGWRRFSVTLTEANVGFLFIYSTNDTTEAAGTVRAIAQDNLAEDGGEPLPEFCNTLAQLQAGVKFRVEKTGTAITLYAAGADEAFVKIAETACGADDAGKISFRGSYDTWQFSGFTLTREEA